MARLEGRLSIAWLIPDWIHPNKLWVQWEQLSSWSCVAATSGSGPQIQHKSQIPIDV